MYIILHPYIQARIKWREKQLIAGNPQLFIHYDRHIERRGNNWRQSCVDSRVRRATGQTYSDLFAFVHGRPRFFALRVGSVCVSACIYMDIWEMCA